MTEAADIVLTGDGFDVHAKAFALTTLFTHARLDVEEVSDVLSRFAGDAEK